MSIVLKSVFSGLLLFAIGMWLGASISGELGYQRGFCHVQDVSVDTSDGLHFVVSVHGINPKIDCARFRP